MRSRYGEVAAVGPVAALVPALTKSGVGRWLLADPPRRGALHVEY